MEVKIAGQEKEVDNKCDMEWVKVWCLQADLDDGLLHLGISAVTY